MANSSQRRTKSASAESAMWIRTRAAALSLIEAGADRIGSSSSLVLIGAR